MIWGKKKMAYCAKCGSQLNDGDNACSNCGEPVFKAAEPVVVNQSNDKVMGVLAYLGILSLIPYFVKDQSSFVRFHAVRGLNLFLLELIGGVGSSIVGFIIPGLGSLLGWICSVAGLVFSIIGIINVANGEQKDLPIIGGIQFVK
jgi:uncharacterized membrane protein